MKSNPDDPRWFMVDLTFGSRAKHFIPLALLRHISQNGVLPPEIEYIGEEGFKAVQGMDLVTRGRLSVQRVGKLAWNAIVLLAERGGWEDINLKGGPKSSKQGKQKVKPVARRTKKKVEEGSVDSANEDEETVATGRRNKQSKIGRSDQSEEGEESEDLTREASRKRRRKGELDEDYKSSRRSKRRKR